MENYDFSGWATRNDLKCSDGRVIRKDAFKHCDGMEVPLVWKHQHSDIENVLGKAVLENREEGVYAYGSFNDTNKGQAAKKQVEHGDIRSLSIFANKLKEVGKDVVKGDIKELSLVLAGANPGAYIDFVMSHSEDELLSLEACYDENLMLYHSQKEEEKKKDDEKDDKNKEKNESSDGKKNNKPYLPDNSDGSETIKSMIDSMDEENREKLYAVIGTMVKNIEKGEGENDMKHNVFESEKDENVLSHDAIKTIIDDGKRFGSLKDSFLSHAEEYGIENIEYMFPDARSVDAQPQFIQRDMTWVQKVIDGTHHTPFSRIKSIFADITEDEARAKGYIKGKLKKEEVFSLLKRTTTPTTIYKKQKLDRDDVIDITDFDVVAWLKTEMRMMLNEEIARAILVGDGRLASSDDKIDETNIRPIYNDSDLYAVKALVNLSSNATDDDKARAFIKAAIKNRKKYKGSGNPTLFTTEDVVTDCLLLEDKMGRRLYESVNDLATTLRVREIITVEPMEGVSRKDDSGKTYNLMGLIVNLSDYNVGADKGGAVNMFDDFDIDYNQQKYLIETRCSGALVKPHSALVIESLVSADTPTTPTTPSTQGTTGEKGTSAA